MNASLHRKSRGAVVVEFAIVLVLLLTLVFGLIELGRLFYKWNSAVDAVHRGARAAAIAAVGERATVVHEMRIVFPEIQDENVSIQYSSDGAAWGPGCGATDCRYVRVGVTYTFTPVAYRFTPLGFLPTSIAMPNFSATSVVEALGDT